MKRHLGFGLFFLGLIIVYLGTIQDWVALTQATRHYSHLILVPLVSAFLIWRMRHEIFSAPSSSMSGYAVLILGAALFIYSSGANPADPLIWAMLGLVTAGLGGFILFYGNRAFRKARFPLLFLILAVPLPAWALQQLTAGLQTLSTEASYFLFKAVGIPIFRQGAYFSVPSFNLEVAEECSGIRSALTFLVLSVLLAGTVLRKNWTRVLLPILVVPVVVLENSLRILGMYLLAVYVHEDFLLPGNMHNLSGTVAFAGALFLLLIPATILLRWSETWKRVGIRDSRFEIRD